MSIETSLTELKINVLTKAEFERQLSLGNIDPNEFYITEDGEYSPIDSPNFIGTPTAPTATAGTNTTQIATTSFVQSAMSGAGFGDMLKSVYDQNGNGIVDNAEKVNGFTVEANVPAGAKFTDTTYSEITTAEIDTGTSSTLRTITGRRIKHILDKVQGWINNLTKTDVELGNVLNYGIATQDEAEAGTSSVKYMTPQRTKQAIDKFKPTKLSELVNDIGAGAGLNIVTSATEPPQLNTGDQWHKEI